MNYAKMECRGGTAVSPAHAPIFLLPVDVMRKHDPKLTSLAVTLRKNMTKEEKHLWYDFLRQYDVKFYRQKVIGKYIVDFYCPAAKLVVELDGSQHYDNDDSVRYDKERSNFLNNLGIAVMRFTNKEVHERFREICEMIDRYVKAV